MSVLEGTAEAIPLGDGIADAVVSAQAFHWFDGRRALAEIARILVPGGRLGLVWNIRDESVDWQARLTEILARYEQGVPQYKSTDWKAVFDAAPAFDTLQMCRFHHEHSVDLDGLMDRVASISFIAVLPERDRATVLAEVKQLVQTHPQTRNSAWFTTPYQTDVYWTRKRLTGQAG